jgi:hypothetical protein
VNIHRPTELKLEGPSGLPLLDYPIAGATADEIAQALSASVLSIRPRVSELNRSGEIVQTGARRKNESGLSATVWKIAPPLPDNHGRCDGSAV